MSEERLSEPLLRETLKFLRERKGWSIPYLAAQMEVQPSLIYRLEAGQGFVRLDTFDRWCRAVGEPSSKVLKFIANCESLQENTFNTPPHSL